MEIGTVLISRLHKKGLMPVEIMRLVKDTYHILKKEQSPNRRSVNRKLERLGWSAQILDEITYDLIMYCFELRDDIMKYIPDFVPWIPPTGDGIQTHE